MTKHKCFKCGNIVEEINNYNKVNGIKYYFHTNCIVQKYITLYKKTNIEKDNDKKEDNKKNVKQIVCYL